MTGRKDWFTSLDEIIKSKVKFADARVLTVEGIGKITVKKKNGGQVLITDVLFVPGMKSNLLSLGQLLEKGYTSRLENKMLRVYDKQNHLILKSPLTKNQTFKIEIDVADQECFAVAVKKEEWLWHYLFGHLNFRDLQNLKSKDMARGLPYIFPPKEVYSDCMASKQLRNLFQQHVSSKTKEKLQIVYSDVCGPIQTKSLGGNRYFVSFIDDFFRKLWVYLIKRKSEVLEVFQNFKTMVERSSGQLIKVLRTDGGGEYTSRVFERLCEKEGIEHQVTLPYTPQHNRIAERKNRTIMNMVCSMLNAKKLLKDLWGEAASTATYILNRCLSKRLEGATPEGVWSNNKPDVSHLRVFGSIYYKHVPEQLRKKLDDKGEMIMLGYNQTGGYKLFNPITKQIVVSRDVIFDESKEWNSESNTNEQYNQVIIESMEAETNEDQNEESGGACMSDALRRSQRDTRIPGKFKGFEMISDADVNEDGDIVHFALFSKTEPVTYEEAISNRKWVDAMKDELQSIVKNQVWELVTLPKAKRPISLKWVFKTKTGPTGKVVKHKARLVVCGFLQKPDIDYKEVFAPVAQIEMIRTLVAIANSKGWIMHQLDVKSAFLNGPLEEEVYVSQPPRFEIKGQETKVYKLNRALYGLKQAPRAWNRRIDACMLQLGFIKCTCEFGVYVRQTQHLVIVCLYVDDLLITGNHVGDVEVVKR